MGHLEARRRVPKKARLCNFSLCIRGLAGGNYLCQIDYNRKFLPVVDSTVRQA